jgi:hypothetical protein
VLDEILQEDAVSSRNRRNPRGVKRKMSNYPLRRRTNSQTINIDKAIRILTAHPETNALSEITEDAAVGGRSSLDRFTYRSTDP